MEHNNLKIGEYIIYSTKGICKVMNIESQKFDREEREYYVLSPVYDQKSTYFVPTDYNPERVHIRRAITPDEAKGLVSVFKKSKPAMWITNPNERRRTFEEIYKSGERKEIIGIIKAIRKHEDEQKSVGKQLYAVDDRILKGCVSLIVNELAFVLDKDPTEMKEIVGV